mgnify:CR=1 FL=1
MWSVVEDQDNELVDSLPQELGRAQEGVETVLHCKEMMVSRLWRNFVLKLVKQPILEAVQRLKHQDTSWVEDTMSE